MKQLMKFSAFFLISVYVFFSCNKDKEQAIVTPLPTVNRPPIARAGVDISFTLQSCGDRMVADLDGSGSTDPDNNIIYYNWGKISGPDAGVGIIKNSTLAKASVEIMTGGEYAFELMISDAGNLISKDTMLISVKTLIYDLDITFNGTFNFFNNEEDCYYTPCSYYDRSYIGGRANFLPIGEFNLYFSESADTAALRCTFNSYVSIYRSPYPGIWGTSTVNLKKIYQQGGGPFNGTFIVGSGSASKCNPNIFKNLAPLNITGSIDTAAHKAIIRIYGKTYF